VLFQFCKSIAMAFLLGNCMVLTAGSGPANSIYSITNSNVMPNSGVIFGRICDENGLTFTNVNTGIAIQNYGFRDLFILRVPEGIYKLTGIGSVEGSMESFNPFTFEVKAGETVYIGSIIPSWTSRMTQESCLKCIALELDFSKTHKNYGLARSRLQKFLHGERKTDDYPVYIAEDAEEAIKIVHEAYPEFDTTTTVTRIMK
jgi:hypothetical protein